MTRAPMQATAGGTATGATVGAAGGGSGRGGGGATVESCIEEFARVTTAATAHLVLNPGARAVARMRCRVRLSACPDARPCVCVCVGGGMSCAVGGSI